eukprot:scaffold117968_cov57-Phaeocystis_antarctica.AAC.3
MRAAERARRAAWTVQAGQACQASCRGEQFLGAARQPHKRRICGPTSCCAARGGGGRARAANLQTTSKRPRRRRRPGRLSFRCYAARSQGGTPARAAVSPSQASPPLPRVPGTAPPRPPRGASSSVKPDRLRTARRRSMRPTATTSTC